MSSVEVTALTAEPERALTIVEEQASLPAQK